MENKFKQESKRGPGTVIFGLVRNIFMQNYRFWWHNRHQMLAIFMTTPFRVGRLLSNVKWLPLLSCFSLSLITVNKFFIITKDIQYISISERFLHAGESFILSSWSSSWKVLSTQVEPEITGSRCPCWRKQKSNSKDERQGRESAPYNIRALWTAPTQTSLFEQPPD